ncbi:MAG: serine/threonine-protein kinase [Pseudomonadota bacterium]
MRVCQTCGESYDDGATVCAKDGTPLVSSSVRKASTASASAYASTPPLGSDSMPVAVVPAAAQLSASPSRAVAAPPVVERSQAGRLLGGRYLLTRQIGVGGFGAVFEAEDQRLCKRVAVKVLANELAMTPGVLERFRREAITASRVGHKNIVDVTDFAQDADGTSFIVMEFLDGTDLAHVLRDEGPLPIARILSITTQVAFALSAAHEKGVLHRDLKPANIFITTIGTVDDFVKILDFGISKVVGGAATGHTLTVAGQIMGTPHYMSPEQAAGEVSMDGRTDIYSLGAILFEMLVGQPPFNAASFIGVLAQHLACEPERPSRTAPHRGIPERADQIVLRALAKKPADRYPGMKELAEDTLALLKEIDPAAAALVKPTRQKGAAQPPAAVQSTSCSSPMTPAAAESPKSRRGIALVTAVTAVVLLAGVLVVRQLAGRRTADVHGAAPPQSATTVAPAVAASGSPPTPDSQSAFDSHPVEARATATSLATATTATTATTTATTPAASAASHIRLLSEPTGVEVRDADGSVLGTTPTTIDRPKPGDVREVKVRWNGKDYPVRIEAVTPDPFTVNLQRLSGRGSSAKKPFRDVIETR